MIKLEPGSHLTAAEVEAFCLSPAGEVFLTQDAELAIRRSHAAYCVFRDSGLSIYGSGTGFGPFVKYESGGRSSPSHAAGLLEHLGAGAGDPAPCAVVRATMLIRIHTFSRALSGIHPRVVEAMLYLLNKKAVPVVPKIGSLGASGDLVPLAHIARPLTGKGRVRFEGNILSASEFLERSGREPLALEPRDALALVNGTSFSTGYAALALRKAWRLLESAERLSALLYASLRCSLEALHPALHKARGHAGQIESAAAIRAEVASLGGFQPDPERPLQEVYSVRCVPQILGACRSQLSYAQLLIETEINGVDDNPLIFAAGGELPAGGVLHGGNFQAQQVAFAADAINGALTQVGVLAERQIDLLANPQQNGGAPLLLARHPGRQSGLAGAQLTATALLSEMRGRCMQHATGSIPSNAGNQDVVSMAATAARAAYDQTEHLAHILAVLALALLQLNHLREVGAAPGAPLGRLPRFPKFEPLEEDRALQEVIAEFAQHFLTAA